MFIQRTKKPERLSKILAEEFSGTVVTILFEKSNYTFLEINIDRYCEWLPRPGLIRDIKIFIRGFNAAVEVKE